MRQYRFARRAFLAGVGAATGLKVLLRNLEAGAQALPSPPRFLMMHWPVGTVRYRYLPQGSGRAYVTSPILKPFEDAGLREDMIALYGLTTADIGGGGVYLAHTLLAALEDRAGTEHAGVFLHGALHGEAQLGGRRLTLGVAEVIETGQRMIAGVLGQVGVLIAVREAL